MINNDTLGWIAALLTCVGATCTAFNIYPLNIYIMFFASIAYVVWGIRLKENTLSFTIVNVYLLSINILGISKYFLTT